MTVLTWIGVALTAVASCSALSYSIGFLGGMRHECRHGRYRKEEQYLNRCRCGDITGMDDGRKNSAGIYDRPWRQL